MAGDGLGGGTVPSTRTEGGLSVSGYATSPPGPPGYPGYAPAPPRSPLPLISLITSLVALGGVLVLAAWLAVSGALFGPELGPLTGQLSDLSPGSTVRGADLEAELTTIIRADGGEVSEMRCPDTPTVGQGVVTVCHGSISGDPWAVIVFFEDSQGRFTLQPV